MSLLQPLSAAAQTMQDDLRQFEAQLTALRREHKLPGLAAAIVSDGTASYDSLREFARRGYERGTSRSGGGTTGTSGTGTGGYGSTGSTGTGGSGGFGTAGTNL